MPLILGTNSIKDTGYNVDNSLRFNDGSSDCLTRSMSSTSTSWTFSAWVKKCKLGDGNVGTTNYLISWGNSGSDATGINFTRDNKLAYYSEDSPDNIFIETDAVYRDVSAWYSVIVKCNGGAITIYVNGESVKTGTGGNPLDTSTMNIGKWVTSAYYHDGYMAEVVFVDGTAYSADSFGEFDEDSSIWKPIDVSGLTFGTNGFYLDFENSGSLGADVSGNGNNFTVNNLTSIDQSTDTCTNNFATANPLIANSNVEYSDGNLNTYHTFSGQWRSTISTIGASSGKWYAEYKISAVGTEVSVGICDVKTITQTSANDFIGKFTDSVGYVNSGSIYKANSVAQGSLTTYTTNDIIGIAMDLDNNTIQFYKNGSTIGTTTSLTADKTYAFGVAGYGDARILWNIGSPAFSISSGNTDGNGYGNFEYAVPSGYYSLNTKNLAEYG